MNMYRGKSRTSYIRVLKSIVYAMTKYIQWLILFLLNYFLKLLVSRFKNPTKTNKEHN